MDHKILLLAQPRGFCSGVTNAIKIVDNALVQHGAPVFVLHEIVHNLHVCNRLKRLGARFVEDVENIPHGAVTVFSAHGVSRTIEERAHERRLHVIDATCPLVKKVHLEAQRYSERGLEVIIIGNPGHPEIEGTLGHIQGPVHVLSSSSEVSKLNVDSADCLAYVTQTTQSLETTLQVIDALKARFPTIRGPKLSDICHATLSRQNTVRRMAKHIELLLVVGSKNSSNSNRLQETGEKGGLNSYLIEDAEHLDPDWFRHITKIGLTAGASAPEYLVQGVLKKLSDIFDLTIVEMGSTDEKLDLEMLSAFSELHQEANNSTFHQPRHA